MWEKGPTWHLRLHLAEEGGASISQLGGSGEGDDDGDGDDDDGDDGDDDDGDAGGDEDVGYDCDIKDDIDGGSMWMSEEEKNICMVINHCNYDKKLQSRKEANKVRFPSLLLCFLPNKSSFAEL